MCSLFKNHIEIVATQNKPLNKMNSIATVSDQTTYSELQFWYWLLKVLHCVEKVHSIREVIWLTSIPLTNHLAYSYGRKKKDEYLSH